MLTRAILKVVRSKKVSDRGYHRDRRDIWRFFKMADDEGENLKRRLEVVTDFETVVFSVVFSFFNSLVTDVPCMDACIEHHCTLFLGFII